jgi:WD40 repeat protein
MKVENILKFEGHKAAVYNLSNGTSDRHFLSVSSDGIIAEWNLISGEQDGLVVNCGGIVYSATIVNDTLWCGTFKGNIHVIRITDKKEIKNFHVHDSSVFDIVFLKELNIVISSGGDGCVNIFEADTLNHKEKIRVSEMKLRKMLVVNNQLWLSDQAGYSHLYSLPGFHPIISFPSHQLSTNVHVFYNDVLISGGRDARIRMWNQKQEMIKDIPAHHYAVYDLVLIPNLSVIASASRDKSIKLWNSNDLEFIYKISIDRGDGHKASVNCLLYYQNFQVLLSASDDKTIMAWKIN